MRTVLVGVVALTVAACSSGASPDPTGSAGGTTAPTPAASAAASTAPGPTATATVDPALWEVVDLRDDADVARVIVRTPPGPTPDGGSSIELSCERNPLFARWMLEFTSRDPELLAAEASGERSDVILQAGDAPPLVLGGVFVDATLDEVLFTLNRARDGVATDDYVVATPVEEYEALRAAILALAGETELTITIDDQGLAEVPVTIDLQGAAAALAPMAGVCDF